MGKTKLIVNVAICPPGYDKAMYPGEEIEIDDQLALEYIADGRAFKNEPGARAVKATGTMQPIDGVDE